MPSLRYALAASLLPLGALAAFHSNNTACTRHYTVQAGDTCDSIGQKTLTSTYQILAFNLHEAGSNCYTLEIGRKLCLGRFGNDCQFVHRCTQTDTCESIANQFGISTQLLKDNNPILDCNEVYDGLMLCVTPGSVRPPADGSINSTAIRIQRLEAQERKRQHRLQVEQEQQQQSAAATAPHHSKAKQQSKGHSNGGKASKGHTKGGSKNAGQQEHGKKKSHSRGGAGKGKKSQHHAKQHASAKKPQHAAEHPKAAHHEGAGAHAAHAAGSQIAQPPRPDAEETEEMEHGMEEMEHGMEEMEHGTEEMEHGMEVLEQMAHDDKHAETNGWYSKHQARSRDAEPGSTSHDETAVEAESEQYEAVEERTEEDGSEDTETLVNYTASSQHYATHQQQQHHRRHARTAAAARANTPQAS